MAVRSATDHQKLRETHVFQLLKEVGQAPPKGRGRPTAQQSVRSFSTQATGPPMSQQPPQNMAANEFTEVTQLQLPVVSKGVTLLIPYYHQNHWDILQVFPKSTIIEEQQK